MLEVPIMALTVGDALTVGFVRYGMLQVLIMALAVRDLLWD